MHRIGSLTWALTLIPVLALWGCSDSDDGGKDGGVDPGPGGTVDSITFSVYTLHSPAPDFLRWKGNRNGPAADSPEPTPHPTIGYGRAFRIEWAFTFEDGATVGYRYRASQRGGAPYLPVDGNGDPVWGDRTSFTFDNDTAAEALQNEDCEGGPDCPERLRFDSGLHRIQVVAIDATGEESDLLEGTLEFDINYPPQTVLPIDSPAGCGDDMLYPRYEYVPAAGDPIVCNFAPGDTIPAGSIVTVRIAGFDRLETHVMTDSFCCDARLDDGSPEVRYQARLEYAGVTNTGLVDSLGVPGTGYGSLSEAELVRFRVAPFDYSFHARVADEHRRNDPTPESFLFVAGFPPRITDVEPHDGERYLLNATWRDTWIERGTTAPYGAENTTWYWNGFGWQTERQGSSDFPTEGTVFRVPLRFFGEMDPREPRPAGEEEKTYAGGILSWAYGLFSDNDPDNTVEQGGGQDDQRVERYADSPEVDRWILDGEDAVTIFVPRSFWSNSELFDRTNFEPEPCPIPAWCLQGDLLRKELGDCVLEVRGKTTPAFDAPYCQHKPSEVEGSEHCPLPVDISRYGRRTEKARREFSIRIGFADDTGEVVGEWPPSASTLRTARGRFLR